MPCCAVCGWLVVTFVWLFVRVCVCGLNVRLCVIDDVMLYGLFLCVLGLCVWLVMRVSNVFVMYCMLLYVLLSCSFVCVSFMCVCGDLL